MSVRPGSTTCAALVVGALLLSGCLPFFPPFDPFGFGQRTLVVDNATEIDWVLTVESDVPTSFAIGADTTGEVTLFGGEPETITLKDRECTTDVDSLDWDGTMAAVRIEGDGILASLPDAPEGDLTTFTEYFECGFGASPILGDPLPGGSGSILVTTMEGQAWRLDVADSSLEEIITADGFAAEHALSPDGGKVAYSVVEGMTRSGIHVANVDGSDARLLVEEAAMPVWSPDGSRIAFLSTDPFAGASALSVIDLATEESVELAQDVMTFAWAPDGSRLAYVTGNLNAIDPFEMPPSELGLVEADGTGSEIVAEAAPFGSAPAWSPDGSLIAFMGATGGGEGGTDPFSEPTGIAVYDLATDSTRMVAQVDDGSASEPSWSPDGARIAFAVALTEMFGGAGAIGIASAEGGPVELLAQAENAWYVRPLWSPDGAWIATGRSTDGEFSADLVALRPDGGEEVVLATGVYAPLSWRD